MNPKPLLRTGKVALALTFLVLTLSACASIPPDARTASDPWEPMNRPLFSLNMNIDKVSTKPLAKGYRKILPGPIRKGFSNFFSNLAAPRSVVNNFLQGKPGHGLSEIGRFVVNSTIGLAGLFDVATANGIEEHREDFGQTAAVWGIPDGPYVMLPFLGPRTLRDAIFTPLDVITNPLYIYDGSSTVRTSLYVLQIIDARYLLLPADKYLEESKDPYVTLRESYLQNRQFQVYDGDPPEDDEFFDEFLEEE